MLLPRVIAVALAATFVAAVPADAANVYHSPGFKGTRKPPTVIPQAPPTPINVGTGEKPSVLVDAAGTAHIVWNEPRGDDADAVGYCRLKRGASACDVRKDLVPTGPDDGRGGPLFNSEVGRPQVFAVGDQVAIVTHRYPNPFLAPDGSTSERSTFLFISNDGGDNFDPGVLTGSIEASGIGTVFGPSDAQRIGLISDTQTDGPYFQQLTGANYETRQVDLGVDGLESSLAPVGDSVMAAFTEIGDGLVHIRQWNGQSDIYDAASWSSSSFTGAEPLLASGPAGVFVMSRPPAGGDQHYDVRSVAPGGASFGAPARIAGSEKAGTSRNLIQDGSGTLLASWTQSTDTTVDVVQSSATDGRTWSAARTLISVPQGNGFRAIDTAATDDGGGFAVAFESTGGGEGPIVAAPFGNQGPTGKLGLGKEAGTAAPPDVVEKCARLEFNEVDVDLPDGCLLGAKGQPGVKVAEGTFKLNGLEIVPDAGAKVAFNARRRTIESFGSVKVQLRAPGISPIVLFHGVLQVDLSAEAGGAKDGGTVAGCKGQRLANFDGGALLKGFPISGSIAVFLSQDAACIPVSLELPKVFGGIRGAAVLKATNATGLVLDSLEIDVDDALVGPLEIKGLKIAYTASNDEWRGEGLLGVPPQPGGLSIMAKVRFQGGAFKEGLIVISPPWPGIPLGPWPAYLASIGGGFGLDPTFVEADVGIGIIQAPPASYVFGINGQFRITFGDPVVFSAKGQGRVYGFQLAQTDFELTSDGYVGLDASFKLDLDVISIEAAISAFIDVPSASFSAGGSGQGCIAGVCAKASAVFSSKGIGACVEPPILPDVGAGYVWGDTFPDISIGSCDLSDYSIPKPAGAPRVRSAQAGAQTFTVAAGTKVVNVKLTGAGGQSPHVALIDPAGTRIDPVPVTAPGAAAYVVYSKSSQSFVGVMNPAAGTWQVVPADGSPAITALEQATNVPAPDVAGSLGGKGRARLLSYRASTGDGLTTTFYEKQKNGARKLGVAKGKRGTIKFAPAAGPKGKRTIEAVVERGGIPRLRKTIASYTAPAPARPARVKKLKLSRRGRTLKASWAKVAGVSGYAVRFDLSDGRHVLRVIRATKASFSGAPKKGLVTVTVMARNSAGRTGPAARVKKR